MSRGKGRNKAYKTDYAIGENEESLHALTQKNRIALIGQLEYLRWLTRWKNAPSQDELNAFVDDMEYRLITMIDICQLVQDCIEDNEGIRDIIQQWIDNSINEIYQEFIDYVNNLHASNNVAQTVECRDGLYAMIIASHDYIHTANTDFFNAVEALTNVNEFIAQFGEEIVALATRSNPKVLAIATIVSLTSQFIEQVIDTIAEAYEANYTAGVRQEILCDLFCLTQDTCSLSINDIYDYHASKLSLENIFTINELLEFIATGVFTGDLVVHAFFVFQLGMMQKIDGAVGFLSAGNISSFASDALKKTILASSDEINNDWIVFCDDCPSPIDGYYFGGYPQLSDATITGSLVTPLDWWINEDITEPDPILQTDIQVFGVNALAVMQSPVLDGLNKIAFWSASGINGQHFVSIEWFNASNALIQQDSEAYPVGTSGTRRRFEAIAPIGAVRFTLSAQHAFAPLVNSVIRIGLVRVN